jgi:hypothetical protein
VIDDFRILMLKHQVTLLREWFPSSGTVGQTVHAVCNSVAALVAERELLKRELDRGRRQPEPAGLPAGGNPSVPDR